MRSSASNIFIQICLIGWIIIPISGCGVYSFSGISIDYDQVKTISITNFFNDTGQGPANLAQDFTERLRNYYLDNTKLAVVANEGDLQLEGSIVGFRYAPASPSAGGNPNVADINSLQRLTITVKVNYVHTQDETQSFEKQFSFQDEYDAINSTQLAEEERMVNTILEQITIDIFNETVANW